MSNIVEGQIRFYLDCQSVTDVRLIWWSNTENHVRQIIDRNFTAVTNQHCQILSFIEKQDAIKILLKKCCFLWQEKILVCLWSFQSPLLGKVLKREENFAEIVTSKKTFFPRKNKILLKTKDNIKVSIYSILPDTWHAPILTLIKEHLWHLSYHLNGRTMETFGCG